MVDVSTLKEMLGQNFGDAVARRRAVDWALTQKGTFSGALVLSQASIRAPIGGHRRDRMTLTYGRD